MHTKPFTLDALSLAMTTWTSRAELLRFEGGNKETGLVPGVFVYNPMSGESLTMFLNEDAEISLEHEVSVFEKNHKTYMREIRSGQVRNFDNWRWIGGLPMINQHRSLP